MKLVVTTLLLMLLLTMMLLPVIFVAHPSKLCCRCRCFEVGTFFLSILPFATVVVKVAPAFHAYLLPFAAVAVFAMS